MADIGVQQRWLVSPNRDVEEMWKSVQIQEKKSRIARYRQDIDDLEKGKIVDLRAKILMLEREVKFLENKKAEEQIVDAETQ
jgi:hypothetical protein